MTKGLVSALAAGALLLGAASPAFATGKIYGNYGQGPAPQSYGGTTYGPAPGYGRPAYGPDRAAPVYVQRDDRDCAGDSVAGTLIGGVLGGVIGSNLAAGHGHYGWHGGYYRNDRGPATVAGVLLGSVAGNAIASSGCNGRAYGPAQVTYGYSYGPGYAYGPGYYGAYDYDDEDAYDDDYDPYYGR